MKGINAFSAMSGVDDRFVMASLLPADLPGGASATAKVRKQEKDNWFTRMTSSGWFAAAVSLAVAFGVLAGIVAAGRMAPQNPSHGPGPSSGFPAGTLQNMPESEHDESDESHDPHEDGSDIPVETSPVINDPSEPQKGPVAVISDGITVYPEGYCVYFSEMWRDENGDLNGLEGDGPGAVYQLGDIWDSLPTLRTAGNDFELVLPDHMTLRSVRVFEMVEVQTKTFEEIASTVDGPNVSADPMGYLSTLHGFYTVVLEVYHETKYSEDEYTKGVDEYAFKLDVVEKPLENPGVPETNPRVVVSGGGQTAVFETEQNGFHAWSKFRLGPAISWMPRVEGIPAASVIFADNEAMAALPDMKIAYGDTLTVALDAAGDELWKVTLYDTEGGLVAEGNDLSVVNTLKNDGYGRRIIVILQVGGFVNEDELACYEYPFILEVYNP